MLRYLFFITLVIFQSFSAKADNTCVFNGQLGLGFDNTEHWIELTKQLAIEGAEKDLKGFCEWNRMDRSMSGIARTLEDKEKYRNSKNAGARDQAARQLIEVDPGLADKWERSMMGHPDLKNLAESGFKNICGGLGKATQCSKKIADKITELQNNKSGTKYSYMTLAYEYMPLPDISSAKISAACLYLSPTSVFGCTGAAKDAMQILTTDGGSPETTGVAFIQETLSDPKITNALQRVSASLLNKVADKSFKSGDNIFSDLTKELQNDGFDSKAAKKMATKILGAIATGGPNFYLRVDKKDIEEFPDACKKGKGCNPNAVFMAAIGEGLALADTVMMQNNYSSVYSLPQGAAFPCDSGKTYHFWLSAALADRLVDMGHSSESARAAVLMAQVGYQLVPRGEEATREKKMLTIPRFGAVENGVRMDLNLAAAGASFGKSLSSRTGAEPIKLKEGFIQTIKDSNTSPSTAKDSFLGETAETYEWLKRTAVSTVNSYYP